jgi:hypothetical protein
VFATKRPFQLIGGHTMSRALLLSTCLMVSAAFPAWAADPPETPKVLTVYWVGNCPLAIAKAAVKRASVASSEESSTVP